MSHDLLKELPTLEREGFITSEQAERIRARYSSTAESTSRLLVLFAVLGSLLVGLGIILIIAHNWDELPRTARTMLAFVPVLLGQGLVLYTLLRRPGSIAWREGSAVLLACAVFACVALIAQIYHVHGDLPGYLLTCSFLILPLLYLPGSIFTGIGFLSMVTWYGWLTRFEHWDTQQRPWWTLVLLLAAVPFYLREAKANGTGVRFWWLSLFAALAVGICTQLFLIDWRGLQAVSVVAIGSVFTLVPWLHPGRQLRTWPWVLVGALSMVITLWFLSFRGIWAELLREGESEGSTNDAFVLMGFIVVCGALYVSSLKRRKPFERWPWPEGLALMVLCYVLGLIWPGIAALLVNAALVVMGVVNTRRGIETNSLRRMNLGLAILGITIAFRFFDTDLSFLLRGLGFIAIGVGFLYMNVRLMRQRDRHAQ